MAEDIGLDIEAYSRVMAIGLALCHWRARVDANDVEFVLGTTPTILPTRAQLVAMPMNTDTSQATLYNDFAERTTHLWMLDYDKYRSISMDEEGVRQAAKAAEDNDPYFPKPHKRRVSD